MIHFPVMLLKVAGRDKNTVYWAKRDLNFYALQFLHVHYFYTITVNLMTLDSFQMSSIKLFSLLW